MAKITFKTLSKRKVIILKQNISFNERFKTGKKKGKVSRKRVIRYVEDLESIFVDEQNKIDPKATRTHIKIIGGVMHVDEDNINLLKFLRASPENEANGGKIFREVDVEKDEEIGMDRYYKIQEAKKFILDASKDDKVQLMNVAISLLGHSYKNKTVFQNVQTLTNRVEHDLDFAQTIIKFFNDNDTQRRTVALAMTQGMIEVRDGKNVCWGDDGEKIYAGSQSANVVDEFVLWVKTNEEGQQIMKVITEKLEENVN